MVDNEQMNVYRLIIACPDSVGIVAEVSGFIAGRGGWILESDYHSDPVSGWFFMRNEIRADSLNCSLDDFRQDFAPIAAKRGMDWRVSDSAAPQRMVVLASKESHCLADLLHRWHDKELNCAIPCVISNHSDLTEIADWHGLPFHHVPLERDNRADHFSEVFRLIAEARADVIVLARYMQVIPTEYCRAYEGRIINIHHSFLPSFSGAKPYHQAHARGVKLIGATCHYVNAELDEGPIIEQEVVRVSHRLGITDLKRLGRDVERTALARGVRCHLEDRALIHENRTIVFS